MSGQKNLRSINERLEEIKRYLAEPMLELHMQELWGADHADNRKNIREALSKLTLEDHSDLTSPPRAAKHSVSVSHCALYGGFALIPRPARVGFDVEISARLKEPILARISTPREMAETPSYDLLWVAKEATFKSLYEFGQPQVLSEITIDDWLSFGQGAWRFKASMSQTDPLQGTGIAFNYLNFALALFCSPSGLN